MKLFYRLFLLLAIFAFSFSLIFFADALSENNEFGKAAVQDDAGKPVFLFSESDGKIVVYKDGEIEPFCILEVNVSELPERDRQLLQSGIAVQGEQEFYSLVEDYTG